VQCTNAACSTSVITTIASTGNVGAYTSIQIGTDGFARLSFFDNSVDGTIFVKCGNASCSSKTTYTVDTGEQASLALSDNDDRVSFSYYDDANAHLKFATSSTAVAVGTSLGSASNYFNNLYVNNLFAKNTTVTGFDLAENYHVSDLSITAGDIVSSAGGTLVEKASLAGNKRTIGVVSTKPGITLSEWEASDDSRAVALAGRVPVKVVGPIAPGDFIALSAIPGVGQKATGPGMVVGMALTGSTEAGQSTIEMFVSVRYYEPTLEDLLQGNTLTSLVFTGDFKIAGKLEVEYVIISGNLTVGGHIISSNTTGDTTGVLGAAAGVGAGGEVTITGNDTAGTVIIVTTDGASTPTAGGILADVTFAKAYAATPRVVLTATDNNGATLSYYVTATTTSFSIHAADGSTPAPGTTYTFNYIIIQ
jgi:hypothetical protein